MNFKLNNQEGLSPAFVLITAAAMISLTGFTIKYVNDSQKEIDDEISYQEDLIAKSNVDIIKESAAKEKSGETDKTADWQTYRNEEYGFELKYPKEWAIAKNSEEIVSIGDQASNSGFHIEALPNKGKLPFDQWYKQEVSSGNNTGYESKKVIINGSEAEVFDTVFHAINTHSVEGLEAYLAGQDDIIHIVAGGHGTKTIFDQMLSTFKLIEQ
ncbi:MAG TPA: hypothetical protein P5080_01645 [Candidatus Paceibacterota bacterium]|nr:hypothetical protein [Candidatus Pacearchaeota archaeon]HRZ50708.1 hypothetical protein [Candidatus Paceibacterota bacterium]HSA36395.1 hypothetical protein [Candidatus Paceibacterota bacterium]